MFYCSQKLTGDREPKMVVHHYKRWRIQTQQTRGWHAIMWAPGSSLAQSDFAEATIDEGEEVCLERAKAMIDGWDNCNA